MEEKTFIEVIEKLTTVIDANTRALSEVCRANSAVIDNIGRIMNGMNAFNRFAAETYSKVNNLIAVTDAMSHCLLEKGIIDEERFQNVLKQIQMKQMEFMKEQSSKMENKNVQAEREELSNSSAE